MGASGMGCGRKNEECRLISSICCIIFGLAFPLQVEQFREEGCSSSGSGGGGELCEGSLKNTFFL